MHDQRSNDPAPEAGATVIYANAAVFTGTRREPWVEACAVRGATVAAAGSIADLRRDWPTAIEHDLGGATVLPGLIDAHNHFLSTGESLASLDLRYPAVDSPRSLLEADPRRRCGHAGRGDDLRIRVRQREVRAPVARRARRRGGRPSAASVPRIGTQRLGQQRRLRAKPGSMTTSTTPRVGGSSATQPAGSRVCVWTPPAASSCRPTSTSAPTARTSTPAPRSTRSSLRWSARAARISRRD